MMIPNEIVQFVPHATGIGGALTIFLYLLKRADARDKSAYEKLLTLLQEIKEQRDHYREQRDLYRSQVRELKAQQKEGSKDA